MNHQFEWKIEKKTTKIELKKLNRLITVNMKLKSLN